MGIHCLRGIFVFIVWGRKITRRPLGYVADFCGVCREPRPFKLARLDSVGHVYHISLGGGKPVGHERTCTKCGTFSAATLADYASVARSAPSFEALKQETNPGLDEAVAERLALEERARIAPHLLSQAERIGLIRTPFLLMSPKVEKRFASTHIDLGVVLAFCAAIGLCIAAPAITNAFAPDSTDRAVLVALAIGAVLVIWQFMAAGSRFMRKEILPTLAKSLAPLKPSEAEIGQTMLEFHRAGHKIGIKLKVSEVVESTRTA